MAQSYEALTQRVLDLVAANRIVQWGVADYAWEAMRNLGISANQLASDWGFSASTIRKMVKVATIFPETTDRNPELSFSHYVIASAASHPLQWIADAADRHWSTRDLRDAIKESAATDPHEARQTAFERAFQRLRKQWEATEPADRMERATAITAWYFDAVHPMIARQRKEA